MKKASFLAAFAAVTLSAALAFADAPLRAGDVLELKIGGVPSDDTALISSGYTIDGEGCLNLSYIGKVKVSDLTPSQVQTKIERTYVEQGIFTHPTVTLNIQNQTRLVTVGGEVNSKGRVPYTPDMTILTAIGAAGDFSIYADRSHVRLTRSGRVQIFNCNKMRSHPEQDIQVLPGDNIQVPTSLF